MAKCCEIADEQGLIEKNRFDLRIRAVEKIGKSMSSTIDKILHPEFKN